MKLKNINSKNAPAAIGPYSHAIKCGDFIFLSGQISLDPATSFIAEGNIEKQTERVLDNLNNILKSCGSDLSKVVKTTVFLTDINNFDKMNGIYSKKFGDSKPARSTVEVSKLPKGALIEIDAIAVI